MRSEIWASAQLTNVLWSLGPLVNTSGGHFHSDCVMLWWYHERKMSTIASILNDYDSQLSRINARKKVDLPTVECTLLQFFRLEDKTFYIFSFLTKTAFHNFDFRHESSKVCSKLEDRLPNNGSSKRLLTRSRNRSIWRKENIGCMPHHDTSLLQNFFQTC